MRLMLAALTLATAIGLGACADTTTTTLRGPELGLPSRPIIDYSYRATDELIQFSRARIAPNAPVVVTTLSDVSNVESSSAFGRVIAEQVASRLTQKGFRVQEIRMRSALNIKQGISDASEAGEYLISRDVSAVNASQQAAAAVIGTYAEASDGVNVTLRLIDVATGRIVSSRDFIVAKDSDVMALLRNGGSAKVSMYGKSWAY